MAVAVIGRSVTYLLNLFDYERAARERLPTGAFAYLAGGSADNVTLHDNRAAFERIKLRPHVLTGIDAVSLATTINGRRLDMPVLIAPTAVNQLAHPDGELAVARAARAAGITQVLSTFSNTAVEEVAAAGYDTWFQLYMARDRRIVERMIERAESAECTAIVLTVDVPVAGLRENLVRTGFTFPAALPRPHVDEFEIDLRGSWGAFVRDHTKRNLTWDDVRWLRARTRLPVWLKGILRDDDARQAVDAGVAGIIVSNHGGRQLDTAIASIDALPSIAEAVAGQVEILLDGGIRRGVDAVKALALGANGVLLGRPPLWGLAVDGEAGVSHLLGLLRAEIENALFLCGCASPAKIDRSLLHVA